MTPVTICPAQDGHYALVAGDRPDQTPGLIFMGIVAWRVSESGATPVTVAYIHPTERCGVLFPDGHVEEAETRYDSFEQYESDFYNGATG